MAASDGTKHCRVRLDIDSIAPQHGYVTTNSSQYCADVPWQTLVPPGEVINNIEKHQRVHADQSRLVCESLGRRLYEESVINRHFLKEFEANNNKNVFKRN